MPRDEVQNITAFLGVSGLSLLTGVGLPATTLGRNGESYMDTSNGRFYVKDNTLSNPWEQKAHFLLV